MEADPRFSPIKLRKELIAHGYQDRTISRLVAEGHLARVRHGAYVRGAAWRASNDLDRHRLKARAVLKQASAGLVLSHISAAAEWDVPLWDVDLDVVQTTRIDRKPGRRLEAGVNQRIGRLRDGDVVALNAVPVTSATRTAVDCMTVLDGEHGLAVVNDLLRRGLTQIDHVVECSRYMTNWPGTLNHHVVLRLATPVTESVGEDRTLFMCWQQGLPMPVPQQPIRDRHGMVVARVDFAWPERKLFLEFDGKVKYRPQFNDGESPTDVVAREKRREEMICELTGWRCIRITWADLLHPERTASRIRVMFAPVTAVG